VSETNNLTLTNPFFVGPELWVTTIYADLNVVRGTPIVVSESTRNDGAPVGPSTTSYYLNTNTGDVFLGNRTVGPLASGAQETGSITVVIPAWVPAGTYYLMATADGPNAIVEANETNNPRWKMIRINP
jgi:subtilase family serine protease